MAFIDREKHMNYIQDEQKKKTKCNNEEFTSDVSKIMDEYHKLIFDNDVHHTSTWLLDKDLYLQTEKKIMDIDDQKLSRGRVVLVNPGVNGIGREQRYIHHYIVLGEYKGSFIGVPVTNQAYDHEKKIYYLRNFFEVELKDPTYKKPFNEYRCSKPSVADVRNICGLDKRRILEVKKFAPKTYLNAISQKIRDSLAIIIE